MITIEMLLSIKKEDLPKIAETLDREDLAQLVQWLNEKDDKIRYRSLLLLQNRSAISSDVYPFWNVFCEKLKSDNSYQRSIGIMLIAENARWDTENKLEEIIEEYLLHLNDEKPITIRQCIQSLQKILPYKKSLHFKIADRLMSVDFSQIKETMRKLILMDILEVLAMIRKSETNDKIESYILKALTGGLLDKKSIKQIESILR